MVDVGIPYFPFPNRPVKNGKKHSTSHTLHITSPILDSIPTWDGPIEAATSATRCNNARVVARTKIRDSSKVNRPASLSLSSTGVVDWSFFVTSKMVFDNPRSFRITLKNPNNLAVTVVILPILRLFQHARLESPAPQYSNSVKVVSDIGIKHSWLLDLHYWAYFCYITNFIINLRAWDFRLGDQDYNPPTIWSY